MAAVDGQVSEYTGALNSAQCSCVMGISECMFNQTVNVAG
jgi:hypothetical protein